MNSNDGLKKFQSTLLAASLFGLAVICPPQVSAKEWSVADRQAKLMQDINSAQKANDLTANEAKKMRSKLADVCRHKKKKKDKAAGAITEDARLDLEKELNGISTEIQKLRLEKRVQSKP